MSGAKRIVFKLVDIFWQFVDDSFLEQIKKDSAIYALQKGHSIECSQDDLMKYVEILHVWLCSYKAQTYGEVITYTFTMPLFVQLWQEMVAKNCMDFSILMIVGVGML